MSILAAEDVSTWVRGTGLEIVLVVLGAILAARGIHWGAGRIGRTTESHIVRLSQAGIAPSTSSRQSRALLQVGEWLAIGTIGVVAVLLVLDRLGVPPSSLIPTAAVLGVALGFGAQRVVQDLLAGFFLVSEQQYGFGDVIRIGPVGATTGVTGTVETLTLRTTRLRTIEGEVVVIPNGEIRQVTNLSREWSRVVVDVRLPIDEDLERIIDRLREVVDDLGRDPEWKPLLLESPAVLGVESLDLVSAQVRVATRTQPGQQFSVGRELRRRIASALRELEVSAPSTLVTQ